MSTEEADALTEQAREERRLVISNNRAWASAETVRRAWLKAYLARKSPAKGSAAFLAGELILGGFEIRRAMERGSTMLCELLGYKDRTARKTAAAAAGQASDARAQVLALAVVLAALEEDITREAWRRPTEANKRYLRFLASIGYQPSDVEQLVLGKPKPARKRSTPAKPADNPVTVDRDKVGDQAADDQATDDQATDAVAAATRW